MSEENMNFEIKSRVMGEEPSYNNAKVKVFGVGGAGGNTVNRMKQMNIDGVEYYAVNTDAMALDLSLADHKILIGAKTTANLGAGMDPERGRKAAEENIDDIKEAMKGADMVFVTAGMGGGTGTGAAPIVASVARELGILTVAVVTRPFRFEGNARTSLANKGIENLRAAVDTIIIIENKKLLTMLSNCNKNATMEEAFRIADEILGNAVQSICGIMFRHGLVHVDFADIRKVMMNGGTALMGTGFAQGENRGTIAVDMALASPLLEDISIAGASGVLVNVVHGENYSLIEHNDAMEHIYEKVGEEGDPNIIIGDITDTALGDKVCITIIATGCGGQSNAPKAPVAKATNLNTTIKQTPSIQTSTARPTSFNIFGNLNAKAPEVAPKPVSVAPVSAAYTAPATAPAASAAPAAQTISIPSITQTQAVKSVGSVFSAKEFVATAPAEESVIAQGSSEFPAVADEDRYNGGRGIEMSTREQPSATKVAAKVTEDFENSDILGGKVDYSVPAYLRGNSMNNF